MTDFAPIIVATPTIMDGQVLRWYRSLSAVAYVESVASVSRNGITIEVEGIKGVDAIKELLNELNFIYSRLKSGQNCNKYATHAKSGLLSRGKGLHEVEDHEPIPCS